jgi:hypothetical protein
MSDSLTSPPNLSMPDIIADLPAAPLLSRCLRRCYPLFAPLFAPLLPAVSPAVIPLLSRCFFDRK